MTQNEHVNMDVNEHSPACDHFECWCNSIMATKDIMLNGCINNTKGAKSQGTTEGMQKYIYSNVFTSLLTGNKGCVCIITACNYPSLLQK